LLQVRAGPADGVAPEVTAGDERLRRLARRGPERRDDRSGTPLRRQRRQADLLQLTPDEVPQAAVALVTRLGQFLRCEPLQGRLQRTKGGGREGEARAHAAERGRQ